MIENIRNVLKTGGFPVAMMLFASIVGVAVIVERLVRLGGFLGRVKRLFVQLTPFITKGSFREARKLCKHEKHMIADVFSAPLEKVGHASFEGLWASAERKRQQIVADIKKPLWILGTIGATTPFVGLFGTILGIMDSFHKLKSSKQMGFDVVAPGITEALVATAVGIGIAVIVLVAYNYFQARIQRIGNELKWIVEEYMEDVREGLSKAAHSETVLLTESTHGAG